MSGNGKDKTKKGPKLGAPQRIKATSRDIAMAQIAVEDFFHIRRRKGVYQGKYTLQELADAGWIRKENGEHYEYEDAGSSIYTQIAKDIAAGKKFYLTNPETEETTRLQKDAENKKAWALYKQPVEKRDFVDGYYKKDMMNRLRAVRDRVEATGTRSGDSASLLAWREALKTGMEKLEKSPYQDDFKQVFSDLSKLSEKYRIEKIGQSINHTRSERISAAAEMAVLADAVKRNRDPEDIVRTPAEKLQQQIAEKFVKSYALRRAKLKNNPAAVEEADKLLSDSEVFQAKAAELMGRPYFRKRYGGDGPEAMALLEKEAAASPSEIFKILSAAGAEYEAKHLQEVREQEKAAQKEEPIQAELPENQPKPEEKEAEKKQEQPPIQAELPENQPKPEEPEKKAAEPKPEEAEKKPEEAEKEKDVAPTRLDSHRKDIKYSDEVINDFRDQILEIKKSLDDLKRVHRTSDQFKQLDRELTIAQIRLKQGSYINYGRMAAQIGDAADAYFKFRMKDVDNRRAHGRLTAALKLRHIADAMNEGKKPSENVPTEDELNKEIIQSKIVSQQAKVLLESKDPKEQRLGKALQTKPESFRKSVEEVAQSPAFRNYFGAMDSAALEENSKKMRKNLSEDMAKHAAKTVKVKGKNAAVKAAEQQQPVKEEVKKDNPQVQSAKSQVGLV